MEKPAVKTKFTESERVLCFHGPLIYEAKCLKVQAKDKQIKYFIHYAGWNKNWDEWVPESRVLKLNDANISRQKDLQKAHEASLRNKKSKKEKKKFPKELTKEGGGGGGVGAAGPGPGGLAAGTGAAPGAGGPGSTTGPPTAPSTGSGAGDDSRSSTPSTDRSGGGPGKRSAASTPTTPASARDEADTRKKRSRTDNTVDTVSEEQFMTAVEVRVRLPDELKPALVDDWDLINRQRKLPIVPAKVTIDTILADYIRAKTSNKNITPNKESAVQEVVAGLREYFNVMLGTQLLYKFERPQYAEILQQHKDKQASDIYGFIHLIRLFVRLGQMLAYTQLDEKSVTLLNFHLQDFLRFMVKNLETYYSIQDYGVAPPEYHRKAIS
ncbi:mortality factor 4-like protein 1 isoform X1 [Eriocheir sinensis]|uniref:mortality factor 4-like protein 1 isoform X1 n=1 Tax=Eriocheir sinensis TaxID=95602 RepID=UPI0021C5DCD4|nr:mortality factor 4-like protein 1 isoform X1 [Eriocheir sinensis]XP_050697467.1 mortality factor 4-like protein 1 isoform X1 [Eriocheir sinensis]